MPESLQALQRANPRRREGFAESVEAVAEAVRTELLLSPPTPRTAARPRHTTRPRRRRGLVGVSAVGAALAVAAGLTVFFTVGTPGGGHGVADAAAAVQDGRGGHGGLGRAVRHGRRSDHAQRRALGRLDDPVARRRPGAQERYPGRGTGRWAAGSSSSTG